jgi:hypothetical protein
MKLSRKRWAGYVARMGDIRNALVRKPEGMILLQRSRYRWKDNIGIYLRNTMWETVDWMHLTKDKGYWWALVNK